MAVLLALGAVLAVPAPAAADLRLCNDTTSLVGVSLGYRDGKAWITEGWWRVPAGTCASLVEGDLSSRFYYLYAEDAERGDQWRGDVEMCMADSQFRIEGRQDCYARGHSQAGFFEVDTGNKPTWMVRLSDDNSRAAPDAPSAEAPASDGSASGAPAPEAAAPSPTDARPSPQSPAGPADPAASPPDPAPADPAPTDPAPPGAPGAGSGD